MKAGVNHSKMGNLETQTRRLASMGHTTAFRKNTALRGEGEPLNYRRLVIPLILIALVSMACRLAQLGQPDIVTSEPTEDDVLQLPLVPSPSPIPTIAPTQESCLIGNWQVSGLSDYILAFIPPELAEQYSLQYQGTNGSIYFSLLPDGSLSMQADALEILFEAKMSIFTVPVSAILDGQVSGKYSVDGDTLTTSDMDTSGLSASAQAMGNQLMDKAQIIDAIPLLSPPFNTAQYSCSGDTLQLRLPAYPESLPPLVLNRMK